MKPKLRLLLLPYIIIGTGFLLLYCFVCWLLVIKLHLVDPDEEIINFWLPFILAWIPILIWLKPQIKKLQLNRAGNRSPDLGYMMVAAFGIAAPVIVSMTYLESSTGKITTVKNVDEITAHPPAKFYAFKNYFADKENKAIEYTANVSGRYNSDLNLDIYIACPLYDSDETTLITPAPIYSPHDSAAIAPPHIAGQKYPMVILDGKEITQEQLYTISPQTVERVDILKGKAAIALYGEKAGNGVMIIQLKKSGKPPVAWLGIHYGKQISNYSNKNEKAEEEDIFYDESLRDYKFLELSGYSYFERSGNNDHRRNFRKAIAKSVSGNYSTNAIILEPKTGDFNKRTGHEFPWIFGAFAIGLCIWTIMVLIPKINTAPAVPDADRQKENPFYSGFRYLIPREGYFITPLLIDMNLLVYLLMALSGIGFIDFNTTGLLKWGANSLPYTSDGQWWRLITCIFVHAGLIHLFSNMIALLFIGIILEPVIGKKTFAISYFLCGFTASVFSIWWHDDTISVGASGAIFGLYGIFLALLIMKSVSKELSKAFLASIIVFIAYNLAMGFANSVIDNACHIGGLTSGLLIGSYLASSDRFNDNNHPAG